MVSVTLDGTIFTLVETVIFLSTSIQLKLLIDFMEVERKITVSTRVKIVPSKVTDRSEEHTSELQSRP